MTVNGGNLSVNSTSEAAHRYLFLNTGATNDGHILFQRAGSPKYQISSDTSNNLFTWNYTKNGTSFRINADGSIIMPHQPFVRLELTSHLSANTSVSSPGNQVTGFTVRENVGSHWNSSNNNFTCLVAGVYQVSVFFIKYPAAGAAHVDLHKNGSFVNAIRWRGHENGSSYHQVGGTASVTCAANDVLDWHYFGGSGIHSGNGSWEIMLSH